MTLKERINSFTSFSKGSLKSKEGKTLLANFTWLSALQIAGYFFPLITYPYLARVIGVDGFGKIAFAGAIIVWAQTIADWGFNFTATRDVAKNREDPQKVSEIFSNVLWARILLTIVSFLILCVLILVIPKFKCNSTIILVSFLMIPGHIFFPEWFFQAYERMKYTSIINIVIKTIFTVAVFVFIKDSEDYILQPLLISISYILCGLVALYIIVVKWGIRIQRPSRKAVMITIKGSSDIFINNLAPNLYNSLSKVLLGVYSVGSVANGILDAADKVISIFYQFLLVISRTFFPFLARRIDKHKLYVKLNLGITTFIASVIFIFAPFIIRILFSDAFSDAVLPLRILSVSMLFMSLSNVYGINYLILVGEEKSLRNITLLSSVIGCILSFPLIKSYGYFGAVAVIVIVRVILGTWTTIKATSLKFKNKSNSDGTSCATK